jgi:hypothetical protein
MAFTPIAIRRNQPKVQASDSCSLGIVSSATFNPGEKTHTSQTGSVDSLVIAKASARNPTNKPSMAGKTQRKSGRSDIPMNCNKTLNPCRSRRAPEDVSQACQLLVFGMKRFRSLAHYTVS